MRGPFDIENDAQVRSNRWRVRVLCAAAGVVPGAIVGIVVALVAGTAIGAAAAVAMAVAVALVIARTALDVALHVVGGDPIPSGEQVALTNVVDGLCATFGVAMPELRVVDDPLPNACALARRPGRPVLIVTRGLVDRLGLIELEGVVAHELAHVKRHDAEVSAVAVATAGQIARLLRRDQLVHLAVGRGREYGADRAAVAAVRYPPGLCAALGTFEQRVAPSPGSVFAGRRWAATRWLWIDPMGGALDEPRRVAGRNDGDLPQEAGRHRRRSESAAGRLDATAVRRDALAEW